MHIINMVQESAFFLFGYLTFVNDCHRTLSFNPEQFRQYEKEDTSLTFQYYLKTCILD